MDNYEQVKIVSSDDIGPVARDIFKPGYKETDFSRVSTLRSNYEATRLPRKGLRVPMEYVDLEVVVSKRNEFPETMDAILAGEDVPEQVRFLEEGAKYRIQVRF